MLKKKKRKIQNVHNNQTDNNLRANSITNYHVIHVLPLTSEAQALPGLESTCEM